MNRMVPEMLHCLNTAGNYSGTGGNCTDISVLERQRARMKWQQEQSHHNQSSYFNGNELGLLPLTANGDMGLGELLNRAVKPDPGLENGWSEFGNLNVGEEGLGYAGATGFELNFAISRTASCPPVVAATMAEPAANTRNLHSVVGAERESTKKRKNDQTQNLKVVEEEESKEKRVKGCSIQEVDDSKITEQNSNKNKKKNTPANSNNNNNSGGGGGDTSKENSKVSEVQKQDYIHVRARRGQATDSHSLAERVRREKISERMKYLQDLVPGCNKITGKAGMLDEIINYVQSLQRQVEFLSMKLAAVNPMLDFNIDNLFPKEMFPVSSSNYPAIGVSSSEMVNPNYIQFNPLQQIVSCCGMEIGANPPDMAIRRTISAPISVPETIIDSSCFNQIQTSPNWDGELQNLYGVDFQQARLTPFQLQPFTGPIEAANLKMEM